MALATVSSLVREQLSAESMAWRAEGAGLRRGALLAALVAGAAWGSWETGAAETAQAVGRAGAELTLLLRFMALLKAAMALGASSGIWWRLGVAASPLGLGAYLVTAASMAAGPGLIWGMAHVGSGALLLHGGLFGALLLLWRDPAVAARLTEMAAARRLRPEAPRRGRDGFRDRV